jgi:hypothetical protein
MARIQRSFPDSNEWIVIDRQPRSTPKEWTRYVRSENTRARDVCYFGNRCLRQPNCPYLHTEGNTPNYEILSTIECPRGDSCRAVDCWYAHAQGPAADADTLVRLQPTRVKSRAERRAERRSVTRNAAPEYRHDGVCTACELGAEETRELEERLRVLCGDSPEL